MNKILLLFISTFIFIILVIFYYIQETNREPLYNLIKFNGNFETYKKQEQKLFLDKDLLNNPNERILKYVNLPLDYKYGSNVIPLIISALISQGDMLELGIGTFSTPVLHRISADYNRSLVSIDTNFDWVNKFIGYNHTKLHKIFYVKDYEELKKFSSNLKVPKWGLVLVDHIYATNRPLDVIYYSQKSQIVVAHDAEKSFEHLYKYEENKVKTYFKYSCKFSVYQNTDKSKYISTIILSNFIDLKILIDIFDKVKTDYGHISCDLNF